MNRSLGIGAVLLLLVLGNRRGDGAVEAAPAVQAAAAPALVRSEPVPPPAGATPAEARADSGARLLHAYAGSRPHAPPSFLIATVPDPFASHLDWAFDSHVDALRRAFERAGFVLDRFELPWADPGKDRPRMPGKPGTLLFRQSSDATVAQDPLHRPIWLVYLVAELSTEGIDKAALELALEERARMIGAARESWRAAQEPLPDARRQPFAEPALAIVGPVFSGSSASLRNALAGSAHRRKDEVADIVSGSATSPRNASILGSAGLSRFASTLHTDGAILEVLQDDILGPFGFEPSEVAVFQESSTDYGQSTLEGPAQAAQRAAPSSLGAGATRAPPPRKDQGFVVVPFPMSIASLRSAYFRTNKTVAATASPGRTASASVALDLGAEPERAESMPSRSLLTPASIDLLLDEMARMLGQRGIRAVLLLASDVRDKLFLGSELKKRLPDLQLLTFEGNVLYLRPEYNRWLRGMVVLSTYPLLLRDASWRPQSSTTSEQVLFSSEGAEGTFNAVLIQLGKPELVMDYWPPWSPEVGEDAAKSRAAERQETPPIWMTAVGAGTMLPVAAFAFQGPEGTPRAVAVAAPASGTERAFRGRNFLVTLAVSLCALLLLAKCGWRWSRRLSGRSLREQILAAADSGSTRSWLEREECLHRVSLAIHHELYVALSCVALIGLLLPQLVLLWVDGHVQLTVIGGAAVLAGLAETAISARRALATALGRRQFAMDHLCGEWAGRAELRASWKLEIALRIVVSVLGLLYLAFHVWLSAQMAWAKDPTLFRLFVHRAIEVDQGISPLVPLILIGVAVLVWCQWHVLRIRALAQVEAGETAWSAASEDLRRWTTTLRERLFRVVPDVPALVLLCALVLAFGWMLLQFETTLDGFVLRAQGRFPVFDWVLASGIVAALSASTWAAYRLTSVWSAFSTLLRHAGPLMAELPFEALRKEFGVRANMGLWPAMKRADFVSVARAAWSRLDAQAAATPPELREPLSGQAVRDWAAARSRASLLQAQPKASRAVALLLQSRPQDGAKPKWLEAGHAVGAVESIVYVEWVLGHVRRLSFFLLLSVVLTTLLITSYPFQPQTLFQTISLFIFVGVVGVLVWVISSMNRNETLSRMSGSKAGELTWDRTLFANLALYGVVPALTLVSSQYPALRESLFKWVDPLVKFLVSA